MNIKYAIVKNEMPASATDAKYLGIAIPNGVRNRALMTANALKSEHFAEATFDAVVDAAVALTEELCAEGRDVDWGPVKFLAKMHGSMPCEDSAFADGTASLTVDADATNATRAALDALTPVKASAAEIAQAIKVSNVMDVATEQFGVVIGSTQFAILGNGITLDAEGEYAKALDRKTLEVKGTATVQSVSKGQRAYCKFDPQLAAGDYTLEIATKGLVGETTPRVFRKPVTAVYVAPTLTRIELSDMTKSPGSSISLKCVHPEGATGYSKDGGVEKFSASFSCGGVTKTEVFGRPEGSTGVFTTVDWPSGLPTEGDVTVTVTPNPAKTDFDQTPVTIVG